MSTWEIAAGIVMILACLVVSGVVLAQEQKGQGLSSVITGTEMMSGESRSRTKEARLVRITQVAAVVLFVVTIGVNLAGALSL